MVQNGANMAPKIDPGGLSEAAGAARSTQKQQRTTQKDQERPKNAPRAAESDFLDVPGLGFWSLRGWASKLPDRVLEGVGSQNTVFVWKVLQFSCFSEVLEKMAPPKLKLKL